MIQHPVVNGDMRSLIVNRDIRGSVREAYRASWFPGVPPVVQVVHSESKPRVLRAMHAHKRQYDIWHFTAGQAQVQLFDHRSGDWQNIRVGAGHTLVIPPGVSHGFYTPHGCTLTYFLTEEYDGTDEFGWDALDTDFPGATAWDYRQMTDLPVVRSQRDLTAPTLADFAAAW